MAFPATFRSVQDSVLAKLRLTDNTKNRDLVKDWINQSYAQAAVETQALQTDGDALLVPEVSIYALPSEIIELKQVQIQGASDTSYSAPLTRTSIDQIGSWRQAGGSAGAVGFYALVGLNQLELWPTPTNADRILFYYSYLPPPLVNDNDVPLFQEPFASNILEYGALAKAAEMQADPLGPTWDAKYQDAKTRLKVHMSRRGGMTDQFPVASSRWMPHDRSADVCYW